MATIAYLRVSTDEQLKGFGLDAQLAAIEKAVGTPDAIYRDEGISGTTADRPGIMAALDTLNQDDTLIVAKRDRLARDMYLSLWIEKEVKKRGARIVSAAGEGTESDDPASQLMRHMIDAFAEFERHQIAVRLAGGRAQARKRGRKMGGDVPFGYRLDSDGKHLIEDTDEQEVIRLIRQLRTEGESLRAIGDELRQRGVLTRRGKTTWHPQTIKQIIGQLTDLEAVRSRAA